MKWWPLASVLVLYLAVPCAAQAPGESKSSIHLSTSDLAATPEMWFYEQYLRQYQDPKAAIRAKAEFRSAERQRRLTAMKWYGMSNSRPRAGSDPVHGDYSPTWTSSNHFYPFRWSGFGVSAVVVRPSTSTPGTERPSYLSVR
jgi:hypothetical protein